MKRSLLIVDDEANVRAALERMLAPNGWHIATAGSARECLECYEREHPAVVLLDLALPGLSGLEILALLRERDPEVTVVMLTGQGDVATAVEAMRLGAENFLTKPARPEHLELALRKAFEKAELRRQARLLGERMSRDGDAPDAHGLGSSPSMREIARTVELLAAGSAPVLLTGETGTGKGWVANLLHRQSPRAAGPFIEVNCGGLSATFLDSELFGHEKGAFTDARTQRIGLFEMAHGGTLFLDEIGDLAPELQPKLLKVLESQRFRRLGGSREIEVDVRLVAATHHDLAAAVAAGRFRQDLFYRLAVLPLELPPLRERGREAILELAHRLLHDLRRRLGQGPSRLSAEACAYLARYAWPGNIRELRNVLERVLLLAARDEEIRPEHLPAELRGHCAAAPVDGWSSGGSSSFEGAHDVHQAIGEDLSLRAAEARHIARVLELCAGNRVHAARALGISRGTLYKSLRETAGRHAAR